MAFNYRKQTEDNYPIPVKAIKQSTLDLQDSYDLNASKCSRENIIKQVEKCIMNDRQNTYGTPEDNFQKITDYWNTYLNIKDDTFKLTKQDVAIMMVLLKVARMGTSPNHLDNFVDAAGYSIIAGSFCNTEKETEDDNK